jgi:hypothetical protein
MTSFQIFALYVLPVVVTAAAAVGAWLVIRADRKHDRLHPGE